MANWDVTKPADTDLVRNFPAAHRTDKTTLQTDLQVEHDVLPTAAAGTGRHKFPSGTTAQRPATPPTGAIFFNTQLSRIEQFDGAAWVGRADAIPSGTIMLFKQATAPTGWTRQLDAANTDAVIIQRTNGEAPGAGGAWTISGLSSAAHTLTIAEMPSHTHGIIIRSVGDGGSEVHAGNTTVQADQLTTATGGGGGHSHALTHDGGWRPKNVGVIVATKD